MSISGKTDYNTLGLFLRNVFEILPREFREIARHYIYMLIALFWRYDLERFSRLQGLNTCFGR